MLRERTLLFLVGVKVILDNRGSKGQNLKTLLTQYLELRSMDEFHTLYVDALW
ncbi:hypothetical protein HOLleu_27248 [Holothuria leucospilota]|uniref:Uncharacterized protein n=1 Tax=Holothuria leucospilota TaxID=206669 RepID=A0A9Q1BQK0_HOLLE|nr:hypothetical protein HOLleu_27248 [Holothuria leucospilota]